MIIKLIQINSVKAVKIVEIISQNPKIKYDELWKKVKENRVANCSAAAKLFAKAEFNVLLNDLKLTNKIKKTANREYYL